MSAGQTATADITVVAASSSPAPNAQNLGVNNLTGTATASNTGGTISRGATRRVILFGPGLSGTQQLSISGPADLTVTGFSGITATDGTPGVSFQLAAASNAALGARTVRLQSTNGDVTTFTGSLEVVP